MLPSCVATAGEFPPTMDTNRLNLDPERDQNNQQRKLDFLNEPVERSIYNPHALQTPVSPYQAMAGSIKNRRKPDLTYGLGPE